MTFRRARGMLLRLVRRRTASIIVGLALAAPSAYLEFSGRYGAWWVDGLNLVLCATGLALIWTGLTGVRADWVDEDA
jgi:hypothetical protein